MTLYQQQVLAMAITLAKREFADKTITETVLGAMDKWIERFGVQFGIIWKVTHTLEFPVDNSPVILTFNALVANPATEVTIKSEPSPDEGN